MRKFKMMSLLSLFMILSGCSPVNTVSSPDYPAENSESLGNDACTVQSSENQFSEITSEPSVVIPTTESSINTTDLSAVFDENFNSFYTIENDTVNASVKDDNTEIVNSEDGNENKTQELSSQSNTEIIFMDEPVDMTVSSEEVIENDNSVVGGSYEIKTGNYTMISTITKIIDSENKVLSFLNDGVDEIRYSLYSGENVVFDSGFLNPGESIDWDAYSSLESGFHEFDYLYEVKGNTVTTTVYTSTACIQVEK